VTLAFLVQGFLGAALGTVPVLQEERPAEIATSVVRLGSAEEQLAHAQILRSTMSRCVGPERGRRCDEALEAFRAVRRLHPGARAQGAEASYQAGRMLASAGRVAEAREELDSARELGQGSALGPRSEFEIGRLERRLGRAGEALDAFFAAASDPDASRSTCDAAWLEVGSLWAEAGRSDDARRAWRRVAERGAEPLDRIRAFDRLGRTWIEAGDLEAAGGVLHECLIELSPLVSEETERGARTRRALESMQLVQQLARRIEERRGHEAAKGSPADP